MRHASRMVTVFAICSMWLLRKRRWRKRVPKISQHAHSFCCRWQTWHFGPAIGWRCQRRDHNENKKERNATRVFFSEEDDSDCVRRHTHIAQRLPARTDL